MYMFRKIIFLMNVHFINYYQFSELHIQIYLMTSKFIYFMIEISLFTLILNND